MVQSESKVKKAKKENRRIEAEERYARVMHTIIQDI